MDNEKSTRWAFTAYESQWFLFNSIPPLVAEWGWQTEKCPSTGRLHYQGHLRTSRQVRKSQLRKVFPGVHFEVARNWSALKNYDNKEASAIPGTKVSMVNPAKAMTMSQALKRIASHHIDVRSLIDLNGDKKAYREQLRVEYWEAVKEILRDDPDSVGIFTQPQYERAWIETRDVWVEKLEEDENDEGASAPAEEP